MDIEKMDNSINEMEEIVSKMKNIKDCYELLEKNVELYQASLASIENLKQGVAELKDIIDESNVDNSEYIHEIEENVVENYNKTIEENNRRIKEIEKTVIENFNKAISKYESQFKKLEKETLKKSDDNLKEITKIQSQYESQINKFAEMKKQIEESYDEIYKVNQSMSKEFSIKTSSLSTELTNFKTDIGNSVKELREGLKEEKDTNIKKVKTLYFSIGGLLILEIVNVVLNIVLR